MVGQHKKEYWKNDEMKDKLDLPARFVKLLKASLISSHFWKKWLTISE